MTDNRLFKSLSISTAVAPLNLIYYAGLRQSKIVGGSSVGLSVIKKNAMAKRPSLRKFDKQ